MPPLDDHPNLGSGQGDDSPRIIPFASPVPDASAGDPPSGATVDIFSVAKLFHRLNRILPEDQVVVTIPPTMTVTAALKLMKDRRFSQLPVLEGNAILGIFSYRSFAEKAPQAASHRQALGEMAVVEFIENARFAWLTDELKPVFASLDQTNVVLIGEPNRLQGVITTMDVLRYLFGIANPYVLIAEIELSLRALIGLAVDEVKLAECCARALTTAYEGRAVPAKLSQMTFNDYVQLVGHGQNWDYFFPVFGGIRESTRTRLTEVRDLRNDIFHFRREATMEDHEKLAEHRDWLLCRARIAEERSRKGLVK